jgi:hypothetical protein
MTETRTRAPSVLAWGLVALTASLVVLGLVVPTFSPAPGATEPTLIDIGYGPASLAFAVVGALIATRRPRNSIGWLLCLVAIGISLLAWGDAPTAAPGGRWMIWFGQLVWVIGFASLFLVLLLFPDGKVPSSGWRIVGWLIGAGTSLVVVGIAFTPGPLGEQLGDNPLSIDALAGSLLEDGLIGWLVLGAGIVGSAASIVVRFLRSKGEHRQQLKWFAYASALLGASWLLQLQFLGFLGIVQSVASAAFNIALLALPIAIGIAILKHRLYNIDVIINRTLVYGTLSAVLAASYAALVLLLQGALSLKSEPAVAGSTLAVAALFRPARANIQDFIDKSFYRAKFDAAQTLEGFGARLRDEIDRDALIGKLLQVVDATMQPAHALVWLNSSSAGRTVTMSGRAISTGDAGDD